MHREKMKILWVLVAISLTYGEKLDRGYLPPLGAHLAGGYFNDNKLELPKETFDYTNPFESTKIGYQSTPGTIPDVTTTDYDGNVVTENVKPVSIYDGSNTPSSISIPSIPSKVFTHTTTGPAHFEQSTVIPQKTASEQNDFDFVKLLNPDGSVHYMSGYIPNNTLKITEDNFRNRNQPITENRKTNPSITIYNMNGGPNEAVPYNTFVSTTPISKTDATYQPTDNFKYSFMNVPNFGTNNEMSKINPPVVSTQRASEFDDSSKYPEREQNVFDRNAIIINYENKYIPGGFSYSFDTSNGIHADESGTADNGVKAKGSYSYIGDDGKLYKVEYTADENGFRPRGSHLPTPPPIPEAIQRVIDQAIKDKNAGVYDDGSYSEQKYGYKKYMPRIQYKTEVPNIRITGDINTVDVGKSRPESGSFVINPYVNINNTQTAPIFDKNQGYNYESTTSLPFDASISEQYATTSYTPKPTSINQSSIVAVTQLFSDKDVETNQPRYDNHDGIVSTPEDYYTTPASTTLSSTDNYKMIPHQFDNEMTSFGEDFSGPKQYQKYDPNTGYYY